MISIFTTIQADLSPEFKEKCSNSVIDTENLLQKIGELTGALLITGGETPKFVGSWNSVKNTYDILSGFLLYRSLLGVDRQGQRTEESRSDRHGLRTEERRSVEAFRYVNSIFEEENPPVSESERFHNESRISKVVSPHHVSSNECLQEASHNRLTDHRRDATHHTNSYEDDCMDIEKLSAFYKEEDSTSNPEQLQETVEKYRPSSYSYTRSRPLEQVNSGPVQSSGHHKPTRHSLFFSSQKRSLLSAFHEMHQCNECGYSSYNKRNLLFHKARTHIRPYKCKHCGRGFGLMKDLRRHYQKKRDCTRTTYKQTRSSQLPGVDNSEDMIDLDEMGTGTVGSNLHPDLHDSFEMSLSNTDDESIIKHESDAPLRRAETVSIMPLTISKYEKESDDPTQQEVGQNNSTFNDREVLIQENRMFMKKRPKENTASNISRNENIQRNEENFSSVVIKKEVHLDEETENVMENTTVSERSKFQQYSVTVDNCKNIESRISQKESVNQDLQNEYDAETVNSDDSHRDTAVVDLSQFSLLPDEDTEPQHTLPETSHQFGQHRRKKMKSRHGMPFVVVQPEVQNQPELRMTFPCSYCDYSTHKLKLIDDHVKRMHFKKFECNQCGTRFGLKKDLNRHYRRTHKMDLVLQRRGRKSDANCSEYEIMNTDMNNVSTEHAEPEAEFTDVHPVKSETLFTDENTANSETKVMDISLAESETKFTDENPANSETKFTVVNPDDNEQETMATDLANTDSEIKCKVISVDSAHGADTEIGKDKEDSSVPIIQETDS